MTDYDEYVSGDRVVGREVEIAALENALRGAAMGVAQVALVSGEPGIGKTSLLGVLAQIAAEAGATVLRASGDEFETGLSFGVVDQLTGSHDGTATDAENRFSVGGDLVARWTPSGDSPPVVVLLDDAQWADAASLQALTFAFRRLTAARLLAVIACRADAVDDLPPGLVRLAQGGTGTTVALRGLQTEAFAELLRGAGVRRLTPAQLERVRSHTEGNPMHALTLARELDRDEIVSDVGGPLQAPRSVAAVVLAQVAALSEDAEELVIAASVLGSSCSLADAAALAGVDEPMAAALQAEDAGILVTGSGVGGPTIRFSHSTTRSAVYHDAPADRIAALHRTAADLVGDARDVLRHRLLGAAEADEALAMKADATAEALARAGAWTEAATWMGASARVSSTAQARTRRVLTAELYRLYGGAKPRVVPGSELDAGGDHPLRHVLLAMWAVHTSRFAEAEAFARTAWEMVDPSSDAETASRVAALMFAALQGQLRSDEALQWAYTAADVLTEGRDAVGEDPLTSLIYGLIVNGRVEEAREVAAERVREPVGQGAVSPGLAGRALARLASDDLVGAIEDLRACAEAYIRVGPPGMAVEVIRLLAEAQYRIGEWDLAARRAEDAIALARELEVKPMLVRALATGVQVAAARGRWRQADALLAEGADALGVQRSYHMLASHSIAAARLAMARADYHAAIDALATVAAVAEDVPQMDQQLLVPWRLPYGLALARAGRLDEGAEQAQRLEKYADNQGIASIAAGAARLRGVIAAARGEAAAAGRELEEAAAAFAGIPMPFEAALAELDHGTALRRAGRRREASEKLESARAVFGRLEAAPFVERAESQLADLGLSLEKVAAALTPAEAAVAGLVAEGKTNREVAAELVLSVRTVEHHLQRIYGKLGLSSRTQLVGLLKS
jgi:DNA-binding CsgD family transcriptional regulator